MRAGLAHAITLLVLLAVCGLQWRSAAQRHRSLDELRLQAEEGGAQERLDAIFVLAHRGDAPGVEPRTLRALLNDPDPRMVEWAMSTSVVRHTGTQRQERKLGRLDDPDHALRCRFLLEQQNRRGARSMSEDELRAYLETLRAARSD